MSGNFENGLKNVSHVSLPSVEWNSWKSAFQLCYAFYYLIKILHIMWCALKYVDGVQGCTRAFEYAIIYDR